MDFTEFQRTKVMELKEAIEAFHEEALRKLVKTVRKTGRKKINVRSGRRPFSLCNVTTSRNN